MTGDDSRPVLSDEDNKKYQELFNKLDVNKDGRIDIADLTSSLTEMNVPVGQAQEFLKKHDANKDGQIDFAEFLKYVTVHDQQLRLYFKKIDTNQDGAIDAGEIQESFRKLGLTIDRNEAQKLLQRMDKDGTLKIDFNEWRNFLLLSPAQNIHDMLHYWRHASIIDIGENNMVPDDFTEKEMQTGMWWRHLVAGGAAGAVSRTCTAPLDRLKVLLQVHASSKNNYGVINGFRFMLNEGGVKSLWRGNGINVIKIAPETAIKFMAYEQIKAYFRGADQKKELNVLERLCSGSLAGCISQTAIYPMEVLKTRLALRKTGQFNGIFDCAMKVYKNEGIRMFYRGYVPNIIGIIPYAGIDLAVYETLKKMYRQRTNGQDPGILALLGCGTISSTCGQLSSYPLALIRTKLQAQGAKGQDTLSSMFKKIVKQDGFFGLYRGLAPNFMKVIPAVSISYVVYEHSRDALGVKSG
ncbi:calcium-binding mitochondrial carrier protein SCaMC-2-like [Ylistrum balloti]|uniref:calcium-binding mitochondrial carrier protein SCaMC-2-like n=1 Tax=Ylistrum balloti TaxID=509963 RepID=UPI002905F368|nr:calcium-binding mitochondrial carrier protein SCaMC-2-like [Ylistrum balloti]